MKLKRMLNLILVPLMLLLPAATFVEPAYACGKSAASQQAFGGVQEASGSSSCDDSGVTNVIKVAVNLLSLIVGAAAIIVIIISGFKYITSGGDSGRVGNAKNTLIYALVGVVIAALAQLLVHFILFNTNNAITPDSPCPSDHSILKSDAACH